MRSQRLNITKSVIRMLLVCITILTLFAFATVCVRLSYIPLAPALSITTATNLPTYYLRQDVNISGNLMDDGSPASDALISMEIRNPRGDAFIFRTIPIGNPTEEWIVDITEACIRNSTGYPTDKAVINTQVQLFIKVRNNLLNQVSAYATATVLDGNLNVIRAASRPITLSPSSEIDWYWTCYIPEWSYCGRATVHYNIYANLPQNHGTPYVPEKTVEFYITRNPELGPPQDPPMNSYTTSPGEYNITFQVPPDYYTLPGDYTVYVTARKSPILTAYSTTMFNVQSPPSPPQAAFTYSPIQPYQNMTVTFDASSSSAEGYNDTITQYEWYINDPYNPDHIIKTTPYVTHTFEYSGTFTVELNVTDSEGLWSTTTKPITVFPESGPTADFTWSPITPRANQTVTFDASSSESGWSAATKEFSPITTYIWNFSDGTGNVTVTTPVTGHTYTEPNNYTVTLKVVDAVGRSDTVSYVVEVLNVTTFPPYDVNQDGIVDISDLYQVALAYGSQPGDPNWDPACDVNSDDIVDISDLYGVALHYGETYT